MFEGLEAAKLKVKFVVGVSTQFMRQDFDNGQSPFDVTACVSKFERLSLDDVVVSRFGIAKYDHAVNGYTAPLRESHTAKTLSLSRSAFAILSSLLAVVSMPV